jgi:hypothetical protein
VARSCVECGARIERCNGFAFAGDVIHRGYVFPRELCGRCASSQVISKKWLTTLAIEDGSDWRPTPVEAMP